MADGLAVSEVEHAGRKARSMLLRRLVDVVALPESESGVQDRAIAGDLLLEMLIDADEETRILCANRLASMSQAPRRVLRYLAHDVASVSGIILEDCMGLDESDLANTARTGASHHRMAIAGRRDIGPCVSDAIAESRDVPAIARMLANPRSTLSDFATDRLVSESRDAPELAPLLMHRPELRPAHALVLFWWSDYPARKEILQRFSAERLTLISSCSDIFALAAKENWSDEVVRKGLQVIERRQRNRAALERSEYESLEEVIGKALKFGLTASLREEISYLSGIKPLTGAKVFSDPGGEGVAVLCKAVGLKRQYFKALWASLKRPISRPNAPDQRFEEVLEIYEMLAVAKAQTVLRYWNWSLSASFSPEVLTEEDPDDVLGNDLTMKHARRSTKLIFGR